jgi:hypothetical protein
MGHKIKKSVWSDFTKTLKHRRFFSDHPCHLANFGDGTHNRTANNRFGAMNMNYSGTIRYYRYF